MLNTTNTPKLNVTKDTSNSNLNINQRTSKDSIIIPTSASNDANNSLMMNLNDANIKQILDTLNRNGNLNVNKSNEAMSLESLQNSDQLLQKMQQLLTLERTIKKVEHNDYSINDIINSDTFYSQIQSLVDLKKMQLEQLLKKAKTSSSPPTLSIPQSSTVSTTSNFSKLSDIAKPLQEFLNQNKGQNQEQLIKQFLQIVSNSSNGNGTTNLTTTSDSMDRDTTTTSLDANSLLTTMNSLTNATTSTIKPSVINSGFGVDGSFNDSIIMSDYITPMSNYPSSGASSMNLTNSPITDKKSVLGQDDGMKIDTEDSTSMNNYFNLSLNNSYGATTTSSDLALNTIGISKTKVPSIINPPFHLPGITTLDSSTNTSVSINLLIILLLLTIIIYFLYLVMVLVILMALLLLLLIIHLLLLLQLHQQL